MRWFLIVLLTLNVCYLLWGLLRPTPGQEAAMELAADRTQVGQAYPVTPLVTPSDLSDSRPVCALIGPFPDESLRELAMERWATYEPRALSRSEPGEVFYRVHVSATEEGPDILLSSVRERLQGAEPDIGSFLISDGQLAGDVSLGLFRQHSNAVDVQRRASEAGVSAILHEEREESATYWLQLQFDTTQVPLSAGELRELDEDLQYTENLCETIAP